MRQALSVSSLLMNAAKPGPAGHMSVRQKLTSEVVGSPSLTLSRKNMFSPVMMTLLSSTVEAFPWNSLGFNWRGLALMIGAPWQLLCASFWVEFESGRWSKTTRFDRFGQY